MNIIVVGCGKVGYALVEQLSAEGHDITVVDRIKERLDSVSGSFDVMTYLGDGGSYTTLVNAGIQKADLLIAVMDSDESNLLCCVIAKKTGNCKTIARVRNPIYNTETDFLKRELDLAQIINPELEAAEEIARIFRFPYATKIDVFSNSKVELVHFKIGADSPLAGIKVMDIRAKHHIYNVLVAILTRKDEVLIPNGNTVLQEGDQIGIVAAPRAAIEFFKAFNKGKKRVNSVTIVGGGRVGYYLAKILSDDMRVRVIERIREKCDELADKLPKAEIINADGTDRNILNEEGIGNTDGLAALTGIDEENILLSLFGTSLGLTKTVTKINWLNFDEVIDQLNLDSIVYPNRITTDKILRTVRSMQATKGSNIKNLRRLEDGEAEALEFVVKEGSKVIGRPLMELKLKDNMLICCISRKKQTIIPQGSDAIEVGDRVVVVAKARLNDINEILR